MSYVLKSDVAANDPNNELPFYTKYGVAPYELKNFVDDLLLEGYALEQSDFDAFKSFIENLKSGKLWGKVREVYPLVGDSVDSAAVKLKSLTVGRKMAKLGGINNNYFEFSGNKILGKKEIPTVTTDAPRFNTGVKISDLNYNYCITALVGPRFRAASTVQALWGGTQADNGVPATNVLNIDDGTNPRSFRLQNSSGIAGMSTPDTPLIMQADADVESYKVFLDGALVEQGALTADQTAPTNRDLHLFARNGFGANELQTGSFEPSVRCVVLTEGGLDTYELSLLRAELTTLTSSLGRSYP